MKIKDAQKLRDTLMVIGILIILLSCGSALLMMAGIIVAFSSLIPHFLYNKCPHCKKQLGRNTGAFCQFCGQKLD